MVKLQLAVASTPDTFSLVALPDEKPYRIGNSFAPCPVNSLDVLKRLKLAPHLIEPFVAAKYDVLNL